MKVCIAEKPSVAREIADILGAKQRKDGYYEGNGYQVTWSFGHLCELKEPHEYDSAYREWNLNMLPILPNKFGIKLKKDKGIEKQFNIISTLFSNAEEIINCGDAGQEGELIQRWIIAKANYNKPHKRLWISSLTEEAIREGFNNLKNSDDYTNLYYAGYSRAAADWLLGMNATRLFTIKYGNGKQVLSIGRVQTPTLAMIVNRQIEIDKFQSNIFFELKTIYREVSFNAILERFDEKGKQDADELVKKLNTFPLEITSFETKKGKETSPRLFDLTSLQVECNKKLGLSAEDTLKTIQSLYEKKLVTYPRVDTTFLPSDMFPKIPGILQSMTSYQQYTKELLATEICNSNKIFNDKKVTDHHAIIPTNITARALSGNESKVYDIIAKRFLAAFYPDCTVANTTVLAKVDSKEFKTTGKQILEPGWRVIYNNESQKEEKQEEDSLLPEFKKGESGPHKAFLAEGKTTPPKHYTEATLLRAMETAGKQIDDEELRDLMKENGIGRPSTRAAIIETLFRRNYIQRERKNIVPTPIGMNLIGVINDEILKSAELTGTWENKLRKIEKGEHQVETFLRDMKQMVTELVNRVKSESSKQVVVSLNNKKNTIKTELLSCPKCKEGNIIKGKAAFGCDRFKSGCDFKIPFEYMGKKLTNNQVKVLINKGKTGIIKPLNGILKLNNVFEIVLEEVKSKKTSTKDDKKIACPICQKGEIIKGKAAYGCSNWKSGCKLRIPFEYKGKKVNDSTIRKLIESTSLDDFV